MGDFSKHEVLDRAFLIMDMFNKYIIEHEALESDPELKQKAEEISESLYQFYNIIGEKSL